MEKQKLLIAVHQMNMGGVQKSLLCALRALDYNRYDVTLYVRKNRCDLLEQADPRVNRIIVNNDKTRYYRKPRAVFLFLLFRVAELLHLDYLSPKRKLETYVADRQMRYEKKRWFPDGTAYDVAVSYIQGPTAQFVEKYIPAKKKIVFFHGSTDENHALHETVFPRFDKIIAVNSGCRDVLRDLYPAVKDKIGYIENYVDAAAVRDAAKAYKIDRSGKPTVLCTCGRFTPVKGFDLAVEAAKLLKKRGFDFIWYIVGDGEQRASIETQINNGDLTEIIQITGILQNPYPYYAGCDIYVQPSREEAQPLAIIEAQILGRPVVTTATVGGKNLIKEEETGLLAPITPEGVAAKIAALIENEPLRARIANKLKQTDYTAEAEAYRRAWANLLSEQESA
ncbi:MAG: glycosyltransferase [Clostridia bacterium]|nr:glycosyltransferase [Clostridia bacterium]